MYAFPYILLSSDKVVVRWLYDKVDCDHMYIIDIDRSYCNDRNQFHLAFANDQGGIVSIISESFSQRSLV
jgi:hypothetical protein